MAVMKLLTGLLIILAFAAPLSGAVAALSISSYAYDAFGRIYQVTYSDGTLVTYSYDTAGNRTTSSCSGPSC